MNDKNPPQLDILKKYLGLLFSWRKFIVACVLLAVSAGFFFYLQQPEIYRSSASIIYQEQRVNPSRLSPDSEMQMGEMVNTVSQQVMSRKNLEEMISRFNLYQRMHAELPTEEIIERFRENIEVSMERGRGNVFSVSFTGRDPDRVKQVANALASKFIEENLRFREERARDTAAYIQDELEMAKKRLNEKEAQMRDYRREHYNEMPEQREANVNRLNALQERYNSLQNNIYNVEQTRALVAEQLEVRRNAESRGDAAADADSEDAPAGPVEELAEARSQLQELLTRYKPEHPEVKRLERRIGRLETEVDAMYAAVDSDNDGVQSDEAAAAGSRDPRIAELAARLGEIDVSLNTMRQEAEKVRRQMEQYQAWIDGAPAVEAEWSALTRDYEELRQYHDELLSRSLAAEAAQNLEVRQKGSQFKVVDSAYLPKVPMKGTFLKILMIAVFVGLAAGAGTVVGLDFVNSSFKDAGDVENYLGLPVACALPLIVTEAEKKRNRIKNILWSGFFMLWFIGLAAAAAYFWQQGEIII
ncbi:MAG: GumC family protein [Desulfobacterales bacterium]